MRTSLDIIPEAPKTPLPLPENEKDVENKCNYERYRSIVEGQVKKGSSPPPPRQRADYVVVPHDVSCGIGHREARVREEGRFAGSFDHSHGTGHAQPAN